MKTIKHYLTSLLLLVTLLITLTCQADPINPAPTTPQVSANKSQLPLIIPSPPHLQAKSYVLMDANSGVILAQKNMNKRLPPASLTKLMTLYIASQALAQHQITLNDRVHISKQAWSRGGSRMFLKLGSYVPVQQLIQGVIVASGNDACVALSQYIGGTEQGFAQLMNQTAQRLGMNDSHFVDSTGLPKPGHYTTAHDLALLTRALITNFPQYYPWYKQKWIKYNNIRQPNRNRLLWHDPSVDGLKTGHTDAAGYCLVSSADRNNMRLISVVMGTPTDAARSDESQALLNWGYRYYHTYQLFKAQQSVTQAHVYMGRQNEIALGVPHDLYVTIPSGVYNQLKAHVQLTKNLEAPILKGNSYGKIDINLNGKVIASLPLVALNDNPRGNWFSRMIDHIKLFF